MKSTEDRRCSTAVRVTHTALVDICSLEEQGVPFQGESQNISGRGMHVRGSYLPEVGETLVCRFSHDEAEVLVEGRVAWRSEGEDSGEFGIQFTALDADSAELLKTVGTRRAQPSLAPMTTSLLSDSDDETLALESGERVRLHIDGLGAPMKGSVVEGTTRKVKVGSALEFLKMGRKVQLEEIVGGERRGALVDAVNVVIHPTTMVPELVVQLRYEGISPTPPPARVNVKGRPAAPTQSAQPEFSEDEQLDDEDEHLFQPTAEALRERLGEAVSSASSAAQKAGGLISQFAHVAKERLEAMRPATVRKTAPKMSKMASTERAVKRRIQSSNRPSQRTPSHLRSGIHDMNLGRGPAVARKARESRAEEVKPLTAPRRKLGAGLVSGVALLLFAGSAALFRASGDEAESPALSHAAAQAAASPGLKAAVTPQAAVPPPTQLPPKAARPQAEEDGAVVAEVPLFGAQAVVAAQPQSETSPVSDAEAERRAAAAAVADQAFEEPEEVAVSAEDKPWGHGRLYLPTIHRIRLDGAGASLSGAINSDGFTVVVPGRKVMESGKAIAKRDKRIVAVQSDNEGPGAKVRFEFRGPVPAYRVRLRQDFVEFLISAPEEAVAHL